MAMTDKTPKTSRSDQGGNTSTNKAAAASSTERDKPVTDAPAPTKAAASPDDKAPLPAATSSGSGKSVKDGATSSQAGSVAASSDRAADPGKTEGSKGDALQAGGGSGKGGKGGGRDGKGPSAPLTEPHPPIRKSSGVPVAILAVAVLALAGAVWYQYTTSGQRLEQMERLEQLTRASQEQARAAQQSAQEALDALKAQRTAISDLRTELQKSRAELAELGSAFQTITDRGSDLVLLNDIDHLVMIAQQQLKLNGNVANAIISLETAQAQLARANRPALASLQQTINGDLDRLRATTTVDIARLSTRLEELAGLVSEAPLTVPEGANAIRDASSESSVPPVEATGRSESVPDDAQWWERTLAQSQNWLSNSWATVRSELNDLVSVRRVDDAAALLISPDQAIRFRDGLRQRIMTAQLALMMDQSQIWHTETAAILHAVETRFDSRSPLTRQAIRIAREVADTEIDTPLPDVSNSIQALEVLSEQMGRHSLAAPMDTDNQLPEGVVSDNEAEHASETPASSESAVSAGGSSPEEAPAEPDTEPGAEQE